MKKEYDLGFDPPAPVLPIVVHGPTGRVARLQAKVDTAADVCGLPRAVVLDLGLLPTRRVRASTWRGEPTEVRLHRGDVTLLRRHIPAVEWLPIARPYALLGRSLLNDLVLVLDGPGLETEVLRRRSRAR
jgi:hypothetical protein